MIETPVSKRSMKGGRDRDVDEAHWRSFDLHQGFRLFRARNGNADSFERFGPAMPDCRLIVMPSIGHSMNLELPALYAGYFGAWFGGLAK
jgi:hypothetical protein